MIKLQILSPTIFLFASVSCGGSPNTEKIIDTETIVDATCLSYKDLSEFEKEQMIFEYCCCYPENWNKGEDCVNKEDAYFVKAKINISRLAVLSESDAFSIDDLITSDPKTLYGKYKNRWQFLDEDNQIICETAKFEGHNSFALIRKNLTDELIIGPLPKRPKKMLIEITQSEFSNFSPEFLIPDSELLEQ